MTLSVSHLAASVDGTKIWNAALSDSLAQQFLNDPYVLEHLDAVDEVSERAVEHASMDRIQDTLMDLGKVLDPHEEDES